MLNTKHKRARHALDRLIKAFVPARNQPVPNGGWLRSVREAIGMNGQQFADRLGMAWQSMDDLEKSEAAGTASLNSIRKGAAALNCRLVYAIVPNTGSLDELVNQRARALALSDVARVDQTMRLEDQAVPPGFHEDAVADYIVEHIRDRDLWSK